MTPEPCRHPRHTVGRVFRANGDYVVEARCDDCGTNIDGAGRWRKRTYLDRPDDLPVLEDRRSDRPPCVRCGARGVEEHHWAPRAAFPDDYELWPKAWLCRPCHNLWHVNVTRQVLRQHRRQPAAEWDDNDPGRPF